MKVVKINLTSFPACYLIKNASHEGFCCIPRSHVCSFYDYFDFFEKSKFAFSCKPLTCFSTNKSFTIDSCIIYIFERLSPNNDNGIKAPTIVQIQYQDMIWDCEIYPGSKYFRMVFKTIIVIVSDLGVTTDEFITSSGHVSFGIFKYTVIRA